MLDCDIGTAASERDVEFVANHEGLLARPNPNRAPTQLVAVNGVLPGLQKAAHRTREQGGSTWWRRQESQCQPKGGNVARRLAWRILFDPIAVIDGQEREPGVLCPFPGLHLEIRHHLASLEPLGLHRPQ